MTTRAVDLLGSFSPAQHPPPWARFAAPRGRAVRGLACRAHARGACARVRERLRVASLQAGARSAGREAASVAKRSAAERFWAAALYLIFGHYSITTLIGIMSRNPFRAPLECVKHTAKAFIYPCGVMDILASTEPDFGDKGWEAAENYSEPCPARVRSDQRSCSEQNPSRDKPQALAEDIQRSMRRARAKVRRLALANEFRYFVTLTLDPAQVDSHDGAAVVKKLNAWASNAVQRHGLRYILVPERHKKGGIHFHGFFNDALPAVDSGTIRVPWAKKPRKPRSAAQRAEWLAAGGMVVYNLPGWALGFTTAMELYGDYPAAVAYVCKYIGKDGTKPAGRWYYSGGDLREPSVEYFDLSPAELWNEYGDRALVIYPPGKQVAIVNGIKVREQVQKEDSDV